MGRRSDDPLIVLAKTFANVIGESDIVAFRINDRNDDVNEV